MCILFVVNYTQDNLKKERENFAGDKLINLNLKFLQKIETINNICKNYHEI